MARALRRTDAYIDIVTDQLLRRRPGHEMDRERSAGLLSLPCRGSGAVTHKQTGGPDVLGSDDAPLPHGRDLHQ